jgi:hypothetical protein
MANLFVNLPAPAANGAGAPVDVSAMGKTKSIVCGGGFAATVNVEYSTDDVGAGPWAPLATFLQAGNLTIDVAAHWMRAVTSEYKSGAPNVDVGSSDAGSLFALLPAAGTPVDVSALPLLKTVVAPAGFAGIVEVSEDGISWAQIFSFQNGGAVTRSVVARFARVSGGADVWIGGANDAGGGGGAASAVLSLYGDGSFGDYATAGDETWTVNSVPGAPVVPSGSQIPFALFDNLTINHSVAVGDLSSEGAGEAVVIFVKGTLTIGGEARIHANGGNGGGAGAYGLGRLAILGSQGGSIGGAGNFAFASGAGAPGGGGQKRPAQSTAARVGGAGGPGDAGLVNPGGAGGIDSSEPSWPYSLSHAIGVASLLYAIGGGNGGGGGGNGVSSNSGSGGGGGGTLVIFARNIVAPAGSIQAMGGNGGTGNSFENEPGGGGGGGTGGTIVIVTENTTISGMTDVSGGAGGPGSGNPAPPGLPGGPGEAIAFNPTLAAQIPV